MTLEASIGRYIADNPASAARHAEARKVMPGGNTRTVLHYEPFPLTFVRGEGARGREGELGAVHLPAAIGPEMDEGMHRPQEGHGLADVLVELAPHLEPAADVQPAEVIHVVHAERAARRRGEERGGRILADPVIGDRVPAVDDLLVRRVEHFERRHDLAGRHCLDLDGAERELVDALGEDAEVVLQRVARRPRGLHLDRFGRGRLRDCTEADGGGECEPCECERALAHDDPLE